MAIKNLEASVDIISALPDTPCSPDYSAQILKEKFDEGANIIKEYINSSLIPDIAGDITAALAGDGGAAYIPVKKLLASYTAAGEYTFSTEEHPSANGYYDVIVISGGGGGYSGSISTGGGGGDAVKAECITLSGEYEVNVGAGGQPGMAGGMSYVRSENGTTVCFATGGGAGNQYLKVARGAGINGTESSYGDGSIWYGKGGDCIGYGKGAVGGVIRDDVVNPKGYGGGGWGTVAGSGGAVFIYGYEAVRV